MCSSDLIKPGSGSVIPEVWLESDADGNPYALTFGRLLHKIMEKSWWDANRFQSDIRTYLESEGVFEGQAAYLEDLDEILQRFRSDNFYTVLQNLPINRKFPELPILGWLGNKAFYYRVSGIMDLLYQRDDGQWIVLDYKTDHETPVRSEEHTSELQSH